MGQSGPGAARRWFAAAASASAVLFILWACHLDSVPGRVYMDVQADSSWTGFDSLVVTLNDTTGKALDTLFQGKLMNVADLKKLPAPDYHGEVVQIAIEGVQNGRVVYVEVRRYDGKAVSDRVITDMRNPGKLDLEPNGLLLYTGGPVGKLRPTDEWKGGPLAWTSSNPAVATVTQAGDVSGVGAGEAYIRAAGVDTLHDSAFVRVVHDPPQVDAGGPDTVVLVGSELTFSLKVTQEYGGVAAFAWDLDGDGVYEDSATGFPLDLAEFSAPARQYPTAGHFNLSFYIRDGEGHVARVGKLLTVATHFPTIDSLTADMVITVKDSVRFRGLARVFGGTLKGYSWDYDGDGRSDDSGALSGTTALVTGGRTFRTAGVFKTLLRVTDNDGVFASKQVLMTVKLDRPVADAGPDQAVPFKALVTLKGSGLDTLGRLVRREWKIGDSAYVEVDTDGGLTFNAPDSSALIPCVFRVTDDDSLSGADTVWVTVTSDKLPAIDSLTVSRGLISIRDTVKFHAKVRAGSGASQKYSWDIDDDGVPEESGTFAGAASLDYLHRYDAPGRYKANLRVTDGAGHSLAKVVEVEVRRAPPRADAGLDLVARVRTSVRLTGTASDSLDGRIIRRQWKIGDSAYANADSAGRYTFNAPSKAGPLLCLFRATDDDTLTAVDTALVTVIDSGAPEITFLTAPLLISIKDSVGLSAKARSLSLAPAGRLKKYTWDFDGDGVPEDLDRNGVPDTGVLDVDTVNLVKGYRYAKPGKFTAILKVTDASGLIGVGNLSVDVRLAPPVVDAGKDTAVAAGTPVQLRATVSDSLGGRIIKQEWQIGNGPFTVTTRVGLDTTFAPAAPGKLICRFRATDDDSLTVTDSLTVSVLNTNASLTKLVVEPGPLIPSFDSSVHLYTVTLPETRDSARFTATLSDPKASVTLNAKALVSAKPSDSLFIPLDSSQVRIEVTSESKTVKGVYTIIFRKPDLPPGKPIVTVVPVSASPTPTWTWTTGGGGIGKYRFKLDDSTLAGAKDTALTSFTPAAPLADGPHILYVKEIDKTNHLSAAGSDTVLVSLGPVSWYPFDKNTNDVAMNASHGVPFGKPVFTRDRASKDSSALGLDGGDDSVITGKAKYPAGAQVSVSVWVKTFGSAGPVTFFQAPEFSLSTNGLAVSMRACPAACASAASAPIASNAWTHVVGTYDGQDVKVYIDGESAGSSPHSGAIKGGLDSLRIGASGGVPWQGDLDDLRIYNRALGITEIRNIYRGIQ